MAELQATNSDKELSEVEKIAREISSKTQEYMAVLRGNGYALPSHDPNAGRNEALLAPARNLQAELMELTTNLQALVQGPRLHVHNQVLAHTNMVNLHALYKLKLPSLVPANSSISYKNLAQSCGIGEDALRRIARYAVTKHLFQETDEQHLAHTATSKMLAESPMMMEWIGMTCEEMWPAATQVVPALIKWPNSQEPQHSGYALAHNLDTHLFEMLADEPERAARFGNAMTYFNSIADLAPHHLCDAFNWANVKQFIDVGGSAGSTAVALANQFPEMKIVIQDQASLENQARQSIPAELGDRVSFMAHDFFKAQPLRGADVYHFRWMFHDWPDKYCILLLRALVPALKTGARVVVSDFVVPELGTAGWYQEGLVRVFDLAMMELFNSKERERRDWEKLFGEADAHFRFDGVRSVEGADVAFVSAVWKS